jgi:hypothetical protein
MAGTAPGPATSQRANAAPRQGTAGPGAAGRAGAHQGGIPGGLTAGTAPGDTRRASGPSQLPVPAGAQVVLIIVPGADGSTAARADAAGKAAPPAGNGGSATVTALSPGGADGAGYVPPDDNEVPLWAQPLLGAYF